MPADPDSAIAAMTTAVATGRITPQRLEQSVRRVLEIKRRLGLFQGRTVSLDSIMRVVGARRFQDQADDVAVRALTLVRDVAGRLHALRAHRSRLALIAYADENNAGVGQTMAQLLRQGGDTVERSEEHTSELQSRGHIVCRLLLEKKNSRGCVLGAHHLLRGAGRAC